MSGALDLYVALVAEHGLPLPDTRVDDDVTGPALSWTRPLTADQQALVADLRQMARLGMSDLDGYRALKDDAQVALAFLDLVNPTNAQAVAALSSVIRIVRYLVAHGAAG